jgi:hypothetical protein
VSRILSRPGAALIRPKPALGIAGGTAFGHLLPLAGEGKNHIAPIHIAIETMNVLIESRDTIS